MDHVAIMKKSWGLIPKILSGEKKIESRWYMARCAPWDRIKAGETVYFKNSGEPISVKAKVAKVLQFADLNPAKVREILDQYGKDDGIMREVLGKSVIHPLENSRGDSSRAKAPTEKLLLTAISRGSRVGCITDLPDSLDTLTAYQLFKNKKYCLLIFLKNPVKIKPFGIDKTGFGMMSAWLTVKNINKIKI